MASPRSSGPIIAGAIDDADPELAAANAPAAGPSSALKNGGRTTFARMARNIGWLLGGRGFSGVVSLAYLAIAARAMGPAGFGMFTLVLAYGQSIANLTQFQSWQAVIRYGAVHLAGDRRDRLSRLLGFTTTLDLATALAGAALAALCVPLAASLLHWPAELQRSASWFGAALLLSTGATPNGVARLFDRFDRLTYTEAVGPSVRVVGAGVAWWMGGGVGMFLAVWALAAIAQSLVGWWTAYVIHGGLPSFGRAAFGDAVGENRKLWRFMLQTNASSSLSLLWLQLGTLAVGAVAGPVAAGGFRIAEKLAKALTKPVEALAKVLYPEVARLVASDDRPTLRRVFIRTTWVAVALAGGLVAVAGFGGELMLRLFAGEAFTFAHRYLFILAIAAAIDLSGFALEPIHNAFGKSGRILGTRAIGAATYALTLAATLPVIGPAGAALAAIVSSIVMRIRLATSAARLLALPPSDPA